MWTTYIVAALNSRQCKRCTYPHDESGIRHPSFIQPARWSSPSPITLIMRHFFLSPFFIQVFILPVLCDTVTYAVRAKDPKNDKQNQETRDFLSKWILDKNYPVSTFEAIEGEFLIWGGVTLNDVALKEVQKNPAIASVRLEGKIEDDRAVEARTETNAKETRSTSWTTESSQIMRRENLDWNAQKKAPWNLAMISMPKYVHTVEVCAR
jgi:hypothetical protein